MHERDDAAPEIPQELSELPRAIEPGGLLEERVVRALRDRGILRPQASVRRTPRHRLRSGGLAWILTAAAAAAALFFGGYALGQSQGSAAALQLATSLHQADARERAALVQHTGSLWVMALAGLADANDRDGDSRALGAGREAALAGLRAAALELARMEPDNARVARVLDVLGDDAGPASQAPDRTIFWY